MLKKISTKKITVIFFTLLTLGLIYLMPNSESKTLSIKNKSAEYTYTNTLETIYLLDTNDYIARTEIKGCNCNTLETIKDVTQGLIIDGKKSEQIPNGFRSLIPNGTEIKNIELKNKILTINFSKELLDINEKYEEKMLESIIYTLTSINGIEKIIILVENEPLTKLPNSKKILPNILDKSYGINKKYDLTTTKDIDSYTIYYVSSYNDQEYYVPVTKYINNNNQDKIKLIINELATSPIYEKNLMSYLNTEVSLIDYSFENQSLKLNFNDSIFKSNTSNHILEEVIYTISMSMENNYNVKEVIFLVNNEEIYKNSTKILE